MSKRANPTTIGLFMLGAIALLIVAAAILTSRHLLGDNVAFVSYFEESVNGLSLGSPVKFKGVPIGEVRDILIRFDQDDGVFHIPVRYTVDVSRLVNELGSSLNIADEEVLREEIESGLRAQLQVESIITSQLFIQLNYFEQPTPPIYYTSNEGVMQIPSVPSPLAEFSQGASDIASSINALDIRAINDNLIALLGKANRIADELDPRMLNEEALATLTAVRHAAEQVELEGTLRRFDSTLVELQGLIQNLDRQVEPLAARLDTTNQELVSTLATLQVTLHRANAFLGPESGVGFQLEQTLAELAEAAKGVSQLVGALERDPSMLLRGKE